jgi:hypothetical protein
VPRCCQAQPPSRRLTSAWLEATHLHDDALGRAGDRLDAEGVTARDRLSAATAAERLGRAASLTPRERTSVQVEGRSHTDPSPEAQVVPIPRGERRAPRPALNHVRLALMGEHHAGLPVLRQPRRGNRREAPGCGQGVREPIAPWPTTAGTPSVVAARALDRAANRHTRAPPPRKWRTRVPAPVRDAQAVLAQAAPQAMRPLTAG